MGNLRSYCYTLIRHNIVFLDDIDTSVAIYRNFVCYTLHMEKFFAGATQKNIQIFLQYQIPRAISTFNCKETQTTFTLHLVTLMRIGGTCDYSIAVRVLIKKK